jgi:hypothetical protein
MKKVHTLVVDAEAQQADVKIEDQANEVFIID